MLKVRFAPLAALVCALALPAAAHAATTWTVDPAAASDCAGTTCKTIQGAVTNAAAGDVIDVHAGGYVQAVTIGKSLTINGAPGVIVSAPSGSVPLTVTAGTVTLNNLSVLSAGADTVLVSSSATADVTINSSLLVGSGGSAASLHAVSAGTVTGGTVTVTANHVTTAGQAVGAWAQDAAALLSGNATVTVHNSVVHGAAPTQTTPCAVILVCVATVDTTDHVDTATPDGALFGSSFHLKRGASAIDQGADTPAAGATDIDGQPRVIGAKSDLGADEYDDVTSTTPSLTATPATASPGQSVAFQASAAPGQPTLGVDHYVISYGDGSPAATTSGAGAHAYAAPGAYKATAVAVGRSGAVSPAGAATVTVSGGGSGPGGNSSGACSGGFTQPNGAPTVAITSPRSGKVLKLKKTIRRHHKKVKVLNPPRIRGVACDTDGVRTVQLAVLYLGKHRTVSLAGTCNAFDGKRSFKRVTCSSSPFFAAKISDFDWSFKFSSKSKLKAGYYAVFARATDDAAHTSAVLSKQAKTLSVFRLK